VERLCAHPARAGWAAALIGLVALAGFAAFGSELLPAFANGTMCWASRARRAPRSTGCAPRGAHLARLLAIPEVLSVEEQIGRAEAGEDTWPPARANSTSG
jgi:Cu/Ag efflux pump CusA